MSIELPARGNFDASEFIRREGFHTSNIQGLNNDVNQTLLRLLSVTDMQNFSYTSTANLQATIRSASIIKPREVRDFIDQLTGILDNDNHSAIIENLNAIKAKFHTEQLKASNHIEQIPSLFFLKSCILDAKKLIIEELISLDNEVIESFKEIPLPSFFENFFELCELSMEARKRYILTNSFREMITEGKLGMLLEVANILSKVGSARESWLNLQNISEALCQRREWHQAIKLANSIVDFEIKNNALKNISKFLYEAGEWDQAIVIANSIPANRIKEQALRDISKALVSVGQLEKALQVAASICGDPVRNTAINIIFDAYYELKDWDHALRVVDLFFRDHSKNSCRNKIIDQLLAEEKCKKAFRVALDITDQCRRNVCFKKISEALIKTRKWELAIEVAKFISNDNSRNEIHNNILKSIDEMQKKLDEIRSQVSLEIQRQNPQASLAIGAFF
ncbi:MAG: hypothetical protein PVI40_01865 [Chlamydiota bacterium]|jgi:hypothetical protein